ncbi:MAG: hypothetical protein O3B47_04640, partial [bacterium]|nr:hypothetical protein [bacterium]
MTEDNTQEAAPAAEPAATAQQEAPAAPASAPAAQAPATPAATSAETAAAPAAVACKCPTVSEADWDKQKKTIEKTFYKGFSPRIFYYPLSFAIDVLRTTKTAVLKGFQEVANPMILDTGGMFLASVLVEVTGGDANNKNIVSLAGKEVYTKVSKRPWKEIKADIAELETELGAKPAELYIWSVSCPKCQSNKEIKTILIAVPGVAAPAA